MTTAQHTIHRGDVAQATGETIESDFQAWVDASASEPLSSASAVLAAPVVGARPSRSARSMLLDIVGLVRDHQGFSSSPSRAAFDSVGRFATNPRD